LGGLGKYIFYKFISIDLIIYEFYYDDVILGFMEEFDGDIDYTHDRYILFEEMNEWSLIRYSLEILRTSDVDQKNFKYNQGRPISRVKVIVLYIL
jgi:hypothetical protein